MNLRARGMNMIDSLRRAQFLWPDIFGSIHDDTPRRWRIKTPESGAGRPAAIDPSLFTELAQITSTLCSKFGLSADTLLVIWKELVKALLNRGLDVSISTFRRCMNKMGPHVQKGREHRATLVHEGPGGCNSRVARTEDGVSNGGHARVWNLDETSCRVLSASECGWMATGGEPSNFASERLKQFTGGLGDARGAGPDSCPAHLPGKGAEYRNGHAVPAILRLHSHTVSLDIHSDSASSGFWCSTWCLRSRAQNFARQSQAEMS